jgi:hypothetical protein
MNLHANARLSVKGRELLIDRIEKESLCTSRSTTPPPSLGRSPRRREGGHRRRVPALRDQTLQDLRHHRRATDHRQRVALRSAVHAIACRALGICQLILPPAAGLRSRRWVTTAWTGSSGAGLSRCSPSSSSSWRASRLSAVALNATVMRARVSDSYGIGDQSGFVSSALVVWVRSAGLLPFAAFVLKMSPSSPGVGASVNAILELSADQLTRQENGRIAW